VTVSAAWYDGIGRTVETVNFGREDSAAGTETRYFFNADGTLNAAADGLPAVTEESAGTDLAPDSSDNYIVSQTFYNSAGLPYETIDNLGRINETVYDAAGRTVRTIQNFDGLAYGASGSGFNADGSVQETDTDHDVTVDYQYDSAGRLVTMTDYDAKGSGNGVTAEATEYIYACPYNGSLQTAVVYPDDTADNPAQNSTTLDWTISENGGDHTETTYDRLGRTVTTTDQRGVVHTYGYDAAGRLSDDAVTNWGSSGVVDETVADIDTTYDDIGRVRSVSSLGTGSPAATRNEVEYIYDGWGKEIEEYQAHNGYVDEQNTPSVQYTYDDGAVSGVAAYLRMTDVVYPNGRQVGYNYAAGVDSIMSRLTLIFEDDNGNGILDSGETVESAYKYLGLGQIVEEDDAAAKLTYLNSDGTNVTGLDRFGRVADQIWENYDASPTVFDHYSYEYDRAGNVTSKANILDTDLSETYQYDALDRLTSWSVGGTTQKTWSYDSLGNNVSTATGGTYNSANEETAIVGNAVTPTYDAAGNMTTLSSGGTAVYDAWNRLVSVTATPQAGEQVVSTYSYDGVGRRVQEVVDTSCQEPPLWSESAEDDYYAGQQVVETRDAGGDVQYQYLWSPRYTDAPILRDTYQTVDGQQSIALPQRVFYLADANYNVTGLLKYDSGSGTWQAAERYTYTPYGAVTYRNADWTTASSSANNNTILYTGRTLDLSTGLYYYRARYYDAVLERFINRDPIGYVGGINFYEYVGDDPLTRTDPRGTRVVKCFMHPPGDFIDKWQYIQVPDTWNGGDPCPLVLGGYWREVPISPLQSTLAGTLCQKLASSPKCKGCSLANCQKTMAMLFNAIQNTSVPFVWRNPVTGKPMGFNWNTCEKWALGFQENLPCPLLNSCIFEIAPVTFNNKDGMPTHCAMKITFCDGTVIYADNGTWGGKDHLFWPNKFTGWK